MSVNKTKVARQFAKRRICPPITGAIMGANPLTIMSTEKNRVSSEPSQTSRAIAREITIPLAPAKPAKKRKKRKRYIFCASTQPSVAPTKTSIPIRRGLRRPKRSLNGPARICPSAMPSVVIVSVICTNDVGTEKASCTSGSAGRYISVESGAIAVITPRNMVSQSRVCAFISIIFLPYPRSLHNCFKQHLQQMISFPGALAMPLSFPILQSR